MRIDRLELLAYGPFTDKVLDFSARPRALQLVYGPNEAGKSSTLRALVGLLYGIDARTQDAHQHEMTRLRIGATLVDELGNALRVVRRKGSKNTLLDPQEQPLGEGALTPLLGGLDQTLFRQMFGLDHERLREGAEALLRGGGQLGEVLFDASTGGRGVHTLIESLRAEADALFKVRGRTPELNAALESLKEKKKARNDAVMLPQAYADQLAALADARSARDRAVELRRALGTEKSRLTRLLSLVPLVARHDALLLARASSESSSAVPADELHEETLQELNRRYGSVLASAREEPAWRAQREALSRELDELRERLGAGLSGLSELSTATRARVRKLVEELRQLGVERAELTRLEAASHEEQRRLQQRLSEQPASASPGLAAALLALEKEDLLGQLARGESELHKLTTQLERRHRQLALGLTLGALLSASLPHAALLDELERTFEQHEREQERLGREQKQHDEQRARLLSQRAELLLRGELATREQLHEARAQRDAAFDQLFATAPAAAAVRLYAAANERADTLADRMLREAQESAELARIDASLAQLQHQAHGLQETHVALCAARAVTAARWSGLATPLGLAEHTPRAARALLVELGSLREQLLERAQLSEQHARLLERAEQRRGELSSLLASREVEGEQNLEQLVRRAREQLTLDQERTRTRETLSTQLDKLESERALRRGRSEVAERELAAAHERYQADLTRLGLTGHTSELTPDALLASFEELALLATRTRELSALGERLQHAQRAHEELLADVRSVASRCLPAREHDDVEWPLEQALSALADAQRERAQARRDDKQQREELAKLDEQLLALGDGQPLSALRPLLAELEPHQARARLEELDSQLEEQTHAMSDLEQSIGRLSGGMETLESGSGAVRLAEDYEHELSRARALTRRYVEVRLALSLLSGQVERYRSEHQQPVLKRAAELFPRLTLHRYRGLTVEFDDQDEPVLSCVVASGRTVRIAALSDGTRDQLYLALRVASIERYFEGRPPLPLILDDALIHFDDTRAAAALEVLGELCKHTQVLFFTHHARMVELAQRALGEGGVQVHELAGRPVPRSDGPLFESPPS